MKKLSIIVAVLVISAIAIPTTAVVGSSDNGLLNTEWQLDLNTVYGWGWLGATPAIANLPDVNNLGGEPDSDLEIVTGSDGMSSHLNPNVYALGIWRAIDSKGNIEWYKNTESDESRGSVAITDLNTDGNLEIVGGTTSGHTVEVLDRFGNFVWTFPSPPSSGGFEWPTAPAVADLDPSVSGLEVVAVHRPTGAIVVLDGDNSDGINDGVTFTGIDGYTWWSGTEGTDWDVLWTFTMGGYDNHGSAAIGDVDNDGALEVVAGSQAGNVYVLNGATGVLEHTFTTGAIMASPALANIDSDTLKEIVIGDLNGNLYVLKWDGTNGNSQSVSLGAPIYSSASIGNIDSDAGPEIVVGTYEGKVYALNADLSQDWVYPSTGSAGTFYASPSLVDTKSVSPYDVEWQMFRHDAMRTGYYGSAANPLDVVIGSMDSYLYLIKGNDGTLIDRFQSSGPIHGSPTVGDIDGDGKLNIIFQSWGDFSGVPTQYDRLWNVELTAADTVGPVTSNVATTLNPVAVNAPITLSAVVDDSTTGGSTIASAKYSIDSVSGTMNAVDGTFDQVSEAVTASTTSPATAGVYTLCVSGTDSPGNVGQPECIFLPVYDPDGGFVTGGGWINSPSGAYTPNDPTDPDITGRANFGFVSKYLPGANTPTGETEFQFKAGNLNFHSSSYQWLVVSGAKAQYKGSGTINGAGDYGFLLTATDGQLNGGGDVDKFRIKIWDINTNNVVYDNQPLDPDTADAATALVGGSIVIHKS